VQTPGTKFQSDRNPLTAGSFLNRESAQGKDKIETKTACHESRTNLRTKVPKHAGNLPFPSNREACTRCGCAVDRTKIRKQAAELLSS